MRAGGWDGGGCGAQGRRRSRWLPGRRALGWRRKGGGRHARQGSRRRRLRNRSAGAGGAQSPSNAPGVGALVGGRSRKKGPGRLGMGRRRARRRRRRRRRREGKEEGRKREGKREEEERRGSCKRLGFGGPGVANIWKNSGRRRSDHVARWRGPSCEDQ